jgi:hypothetical protein
MSSTKLGLLMFKPVQESTPSKYGKLRPLSDDQVRMSCTLELIILAKQLSLLQQFVLCTAHICKRTCLAARLPCILCQTLTHLKTPPSQA